QTQYVDKTVQPGRTYHYRVTAINAAGASKPSSPSNPYLAHPTLPAPDAPTAQHDGIARFTITWPTPEGVETNSVQGYRLERRAANGEWMVLVPHTGPNVTTYQDLELTIGVAYQYRAAA